MSKLNVRVLLSALTVCLLGGVRCVPEYDFERDPPEVGTLGEEVHAIWAKDAARAPENAAQKAELLDARREEFVDAVDTMAPASELGAIDLFLQATLTLIDDETLPSLTRKLARALGEAQRDDALLAALGDASRPAPADFISPIATEDLLGYVTAYPKLDELATRGARIVLDNDGFTDEGERDPQEPEGLSELARTLAIELDDLDPADIEEPLAILVRDMLLRPDPRFEVPDATRPLYVAIYDARGVPRVTEDALRDLFMDADGDGRPDLSPQGDFMLRGGSTLSADIFNEDGTLIRDAFGRAKTDSDSFAFEYADLNQTGLGFLIREYADLWAQDVTVDLLATFRTVMGEMVIHEDARGAYFGFSKDNPIMDLVWGLVHALAYDGLPELMQDAMRFLDSSSSEVAGVVVALEQGAEIAGNYPDAELKPTQTILFDMIPVLHEISQDPALWRDFMNALGNPVTPRVGEAMVTLMSYRNTRAEPEIMGAYDTCFMDCKAQHNIGTNERFECIRACPNDAIFKEPMDFSAPESPENRSQLQAIWHLMWSLSGVPYAMEMDEIRLNGNSSLLPPPLIALDGGAEAYLRSVAGNLDLAEAVPDELFTGNELGPLLNVLGISAGNISGVIEFLSQLFFVGIEYDGVQYQLTRRPTPDQLTRLFIQDDIKFEDGGVLIDVREPVDADGYILSDHLADGLFEAEASGLIDAVQPMAKAFSDHDKEHLLLELFEVVHKHYPNNPEVFLTKDGAVSESQAANLRSFEPVMKEVFEDGKLLASLFALSKRLQMLEQSRGLEMNERVRLLVQHVTTPSNFTTRDGQTFVNLPDGRTARDLTPLHVLVDALDRTVTRVEGDPEVQERFEHAVGAIFDLALAAEWPDGGEPRFVKDGSVALVVTLMDFLAGRAEVRRDAGTLEPWLLNDVYTTVEELWPSRLLAGLVVVAEQLLKEPENRAVLDDFIAYLVGTPEGREHTTVLAYQVVVRSVDVDAWLPVARALSRLIDPDRDWETGDRLSTLPILSHGAMTLAGVVENDPDGVGTQMLHRGFRRDINGDAPIFTIGDIVAQYFRVDPASDAPLSAQDYRNFFAQLTAWMQDEAKGLEQLYDLVALRVKE